MLCSTLPIISLALSSSSLPVAFARFAIEIALSIITGHTYAKAVSPVLLTKLCMSPPKTVVKNTYEALLFVHSSCVMYREWIKVS